MFVIFRNDSEGRLININLIHAIYEEKFSENPRFRIEYYGGLFSFDSIEWNHFFRKIETLDDVGNAIKYLLHFQNKNGLEDLKKARKNLDWLIEELENGE